MPNLKAGCLRFPADIALSIYETFGFFVKISVEMEFYIFGCSPQKDEEIVKLSELKFKENGLSISPIRRESGERQFEYNTFPSTDLEKIITEDLQARSILELAAIQLGGNISFNPKPYENMPGNGMHLHLSLEDEHGENIFSKHPSNEFCESRVMLCAIAGLIDTLEALLIVFAPHADNYKRFHGMVNDSGSCIAVDREAVFAPSYICWGGDNRFCAIRIPTSTLDPKNRHIEHRVSAPNACLRQVISAILIGVSHGLMKNEIPSLPKLYGLPYDPQFNLRKLASSVEEARNNFMPEIFFRE